MQAAYAYSRPKLKGPQTINDILSATIGSYAPSLWVASDNYADASKKKHNHNDGTIPPVSDFKSLWIGRPIDELVKWLQAKPEDTDLNERHFAVLDKGAKDDPATIVVCRIGNYKREGDEVYILRKQCPRGVEHLLGAAPSDWDETVRIFGNVEIRYDENQS